MIYKHRLLRRNSQIRKTSYDTTTDKVHLKCDCVDGYTVKGMPAQILFSFNLRAPPGYKIIKNPIFFCKKN